MDSEFFDDNLQRSFPLVDNPGQTIPYWLLVDFRATINADDWDGSKYTIYLAWVTRFGTSVRFGFRTDCPSLANEELIFERDLADPKFKTTFVSSVRLAETIEEKCGCSDELLCNTEMQSEQTCGPELLCNTDMQPSCGTELLCNTDMTDE